MIFPDIFTETEKLIIKLMTKLIITFKNTIMKYENDIMITHVAHNEDYLVLHVPFDNLYYTTRIYISENCPQEKGVDASAYMRGECRW